MVCTFRLSLVLSLFIAPSLMANEPQIATINDLNNIDIEQDTLAFSPEFVCADGLEGVNLGYDKEGFFVVENEQIVRVQSYDTNKVLRGRSVKDIAKFAHIGKFKVTKFDNGQYAIDATGGLNGGGAFGAWLGACIGKGIVYFIGHGIIQVIAVASGPAYLPTLAALEGAFFPTIELISHGVAIGGGILGAVATGPV